MGQAFSSHWTWSSEGTDDTHQGRFQEHLPAPHRHLYPGPTPPKHRWESGSWKTEGWDTHKFTTEPGGKNRVLVTHPDGSSA